MKDKPQAGEIWRWDFGVTPDEEKYAHVLLLEWEEADLWKGLDLDNGEIGVWYFQPADMKHWKYIT